MPVSRAPRPCPAAALANRRRELRFGVQNEPFLPQEVVHRLCWSSMVRRYLLRALNITVILAMIVFAAQSWMPRTAVLIAAIVILVWLTWGLLSPVFDELMLMRWVNRTEKHLEHVDQCRAEGHCVVCQYDLRGNVTGICPECGARFAEIVYPLSSADADAAVKGDSTEEPPGAVIRSSNTPGRRSTNESGQGED